LDVVIWTKWSTLPPAELPFAWSIDMLKSFWTTISAKDDGNGAGSPLLLLLLFLSLVMVLDLLGFVFVASVRGIDLFEVLLCCAFNASVLDSSRSLNLPLLCSLMCPDRIPPLESG